MRLLHLSVRRSQFPRSSVVQGVPRILAGPYGVRPCVWKKFLHFFCWAGFRGIEAFGNHSGMLWCYYKPLLLGSFGKLRESLPTDDSCLVFRSLRLSTGPVLDVYSGHGDSTALLLHALTQREEQKGRCLLSFEQDFERRCLSFRLFCGLSSKTPGIFWVQFGWSDQTCSPSIISSGAKKFIQKKHNHCIDTLWAND